MQTQDVTAAPAALISRTEAAFTIGEAADRTIGLVSIADGRLAKRLNGPKGADIRSMAASPDGRTIYYTASGSVWSVPVSDGTPQKLRPGDSVTVDPYKNELIVQLIEKEAVRLVRTPLKGGPERTIPVQAGIRIAPVEDALHPNGVSKDGLILVRVAPSSSWFWPTGVLDPQTGRVRIPSIGYDADMSSAGWADDGKIVVLAYPFRSSLWHFRTEESKR